MGSWFKTVYDDIRDTYGSSKIHNRLPFSLENSFTDRFGVLLTIPLEAAWFQEAMMRCFRYTRLNQYNTIMTQYCYIIFCAGNIYEMLAELPECNE